MAEFFDPLSGLEVEDAVVKLIRFLLPLTGLLTLAGIVWGGVRIITALGNQTAVEQGKKIIFWSIVGLMIIALGVVIIQLIGDTLGV